MQDSASSQPFCSLVHSHSPCSDDEREGPVVQLDLAWGLYDLKDSSAVAAAERSLVAQGVAVERFEGASTDDSSSSGGGVDGGSGDDSDADSGDGDSGEGIGLRERQQQGLSAAGTVAAAAAGASNGSLALGPEAMQEDTEDGSGG